MLQKFKRNALVLTLGGLLATGVAMAHPGPMHDTMGGKGCHADGHMMHHGMRHKMPILDIVQHHAYQLRLTDKQASEIAVWKNHHMGEVVQTRKSLWKDFMALHKAAFEKKSASQLKTIAERIDHDRSRLLAINVGQIVVLEQILTPSQWNQAVTIARHHEHFAMHHHNAKHPAMGMDR